MPSSWAQIPKELLRVIFDQIEGGDYSATHTRKSCLFQLMLTCKHWSSIAREAFYNEQFTLDVSTAQKLISNKTTPQLFIKNIAITCELASDASLIKLLSMCPDVTSLVVRGWPINVVEVPKTQKSFYTSLYVLSQSNHLAKLKRAEFTLQRTDTDQVLAHHQQAMLQLKDSLTHLEIMDYTINDRQHNAKEPPQRFVEWFDQLQYFPRLTTVCIDVDSLTYLYEMDGFIEKMGPTITTIIIGLINTRVLQPLKRINPATIARRSLTNTLKLEIFTIRAEDLNYIMHKFDNLSELQIAVLDYGSDAVSSLNEFRSDDDSLKRFFEYLTGISKFLVTNILIHNSLLRQALVDLKECFQIKHLTLSNLVPTCQGTNLSIKSLSKARDGRRGQVNLDLEIGTAQLLSVAELVYEVLNEDVVELQFGNGLVKYYSNEENSIPCYIQGEALQLGINLLPSLKTLAALNPGIHSMKSLVNPKSPKLAMDLLELGKFTRSEALFQISQRVKHIERWMAPYIPDYDEHMKLQNHVLNMPFTTFGKIYIATTYTGRFIVKLSTSSNTTFYAVDLSRDKRFSTKDDCYYQQDDGLSQEYDHEERLDGIGKVHIICADVKRLVVAHTLINIQD